MCEPIGNAEPDDARRDTIRRYATSFNNVLIWEINAHAAGIVEDEAPRSFFLRTERSLERWSP